MQDIDKELMYIHNIQEEEVIENKKNEIKTFIKNEIKNVAHLINDEEYIYQKSRNGLDYLQIIHKMMDTYNKGNETDLNDTIQKYIDKSKIETITQKFKGNIDDAKKQYITRMKNLQNIPTNFEELPPTLASLF